MRITLTGQSMEQPAAHVLIVDDNADIAHLVQDLLEGEGYASTILRDRRLETIQAAVERVRPDCVPLDGEMAGSFGAAWDDAAWMTALPAPVPVIMFSADRRAANEAEANTSDRSHAAGFSSMMPKPFDLDDLLHAVELAVSHSPFRRR